MTAIDHSTTPSASDASSIPDMIGDESGILPTGDRSALAEAMLRLAQDPELRRTMGSSAKERYQKLFSPKVVVPLMVETYRRVTQDGHDVAATVAGNGHLHPCADVSRQDSRTCIRDLFNSLRSL